MNIKPVTIKMKEGVNEEWLRQKPYKGSDPKALNALMNDHMARNLFINGLSPLHIQHQVSLYGNQMEVIVWWLIILN